MHWFTRLFLLTVLTGILTSCSENESENKQRSSNAATPKVIQKFPEFSGDSAYYYIQKQVDFGPRTPNSKAHKKCADWLINEFKKKGSTVTTQEGVHKAHDGVNLSFTNIFASLYPENSKRVLLTAHWDTRPWADNDTENQYHTQPIDGANDGGSGVAVLLEIARVLQNNDPGIGVDFLLFDIEDYGISSVPNSFCYGSQYWSKNPTYEGKLPEFAINFDMVGDAKAYYSYEGFSNQYARHILDKVWAAAHELGHKEMFSREMSYPVTDDHLYVNQAGIPCIDIIHRDQHTGRFPDSWHTHDDTMESIHVPSLKAVGQTAIRVLFKEGLK